MQEHVVVEVAPRELAAKRLGTLAAGKPLLDRAHRDAAEVQIGGETRGVVAPEGVVVVGVLANRAGEEPIEHLAGSGLATARRLADLLLEPKRLKRGNPAFRDLRRQRGQLAGGAQHVAPWRLQPGAMKRREHRVRLAGLRLDRCDVDGIEASMGDDLDVGAAKALPAAAGERTDVLADMDRVGADLLGEHGQLPLGRAVADDEPRAALSQLSIQVCQALEQELRARTRGVATVQQPVVEAEDGYYALVGIERCAKRGMVTKPQVAAKPDERRAAIALTQTILATRMTSFAGTSMTSSRRKSSAIAV